MQQNTTLGSSAPWWKFGHVWLVFAGPAVVVVASFITLYLAMTRPDPVISEDYYQKRVEVNKILGEAVEAANAASLAPALKARNHAATGVLPAPAVANKP
ncbi:MAG: FixH family protein [Pseudomonadota bacterium]